MNEKDSSLAARIAGNGVTDDEAAAFLPSLLSALSHTPDPERARDNFVKFLEAVPNRRAYFLAVSTHEVGLRLLLRVLGASQYLADLFFRNPEYFEFVANPGVRGGTRSATAYLREGGQIAAACARSELKLDALRRFKAREMLRIGVRDIAGLTDLPRSAREFSNLADACVQIALQIARTQNPLAAGENQPAFCVIGMGKLGGRELNYSSDIDLMFLCGDDLPPALTLLSGRKVETSLYLLRVGEAMIKILTEERNSGSVFRVDMRLRPEGRFGVLVRSLEGFRAYYESWAEAWEFQALLKARPIAGDFALGTAFLEMVSPFVYRPVVSEEFLREIRANKRSIERKCAAEGGTERNIKTGFGGIRDVEFLVQLFQLQQGGKIRRLRTPTTLSALHRLSLFGLISETLAEALASDYVFLRRVEHALQLFQNRQTQLLPPLDDQKEIEKLAARLGFASGNEFLQTLKHYRDHARSTLEPLFYRSESYFAAETTDEADLADGLKSASSLPDADPNLLQRLRDIGVKNPAEVGAALLTAMRGNDFGGMPPDTPETFLRIAPTLFTLAQNSPNPDAVFYGLEAFATAVPNRAQLYASLAESRPVLPRLASLAVYAPPLFARLTRHLEWLETLVEEGPERAAELPELLSSRAKKSLKPIPEIGRFYLREQLRTGAQEVWGLLSGEDIPRRLTRIAETVLFSLLETSAQTEAPPLALVGLGKLGGEELSYGSDWDLIAVYDDTQSLEQERALLSEKAVHRVELLLKAGEELAKERAGIELDFRLRPWGKKGALALSLEGYRRYFAGEAEIWERHAALKARFVAGDRETGEHLVSLLREVSFGGTWGLNEDYQIQDMKARIEAERLKPEQRHTDLKLGNGGLLDIEWTVQRMQLLHAGLFPSLWVSNTLAALSALTSAGLLDYAEGETLRENFLLFSAARNALWLLGVSGDVLPSDTVLLKTLASHLGYPTEAELKADLTARLAHCRRIFGRRFHAREEGQTPPAPR